MRRLTIAGDIFMAIAAALNPWHPTTILNAFMYSITARTLQLVHNFRGVNVLHLLEEVFTTLKN